MPDQQERVSQLYAEALTRQVTDRADFLRHACGSDEALRVEVESLLAHAGAPLSILDVSVAAWAAGAIGGRKQSLIGRSVGSYQILSTLGTGGMGEVYRAHDARLRRDVAIKILPHVFASDPERLARFEREAQILAALNHAHIGAIYGLETMDGGPALVLELVDGDMLAERIARGPLLLSDALRMAAQIAEALEAAHRRGVIHRDLKPTNIKITPEGVVKVLDFGLAKTAGGDSSGPPLTQSPTVTMGDSREGLILGTAAYMSPEQARGQRVDKRTDIWAFGCVLYEMLTGHLAFKGDTVSDTIAAILGGEPDWDRLPGATPGSVRVLLGHCLEKDLKRRLRDIGDARLQIDHQLDGRSGRVAAAPPEPEVSGTALTTHATPGARDWRHTYRSLGLIVLALLVLAGGVGLFYSARLSAPVTSPSEYAQITNFTDSAVAPSLSADGRMVTFIRGGDSFLSRGQIYVKLLPNGESVRLTNDAHRKYAPVFAPDGSRVAYTDVSPGHWDTWTVPVLGGQATRFLPNASGLTWITDHLVLFSEIKTGLHMGIVTATEDRANAREIFIRPNEHAMAHYSYTSPDRQSVLVVEMNGAHAFTQPCRLVPFDGRSTGRQVGPQGACISAAWSPDGRWMYFGAGVGGGLHLWRQKFPNGAPEQITFGPLEEEGIALAPDGRSLVTSVGTRRSAIWIHDRAGERAISSEGYAMLPRLSRDGTRVFYLLARDWWLSQFGWEASSAELRSADVTSGKTDSVLSGVSVADYDISRDEKEVAFTATDSSGESQIWLASLDRRTPPRQIARGDSVSFGADGNLVFRSLEAKANVLVRINKDGSGRERITTVPILDKYSVSPDGEWVIAFTPGVGVDAVPAVVAVPVHGGAARKICGRPCLAGWSSNGEFFYVSLYRDSATSLEKTLAIPVPAGQSLPDLPVSGIDGSGRVALPGVRVIEYVSLSTGPDPSTFVFTKTDLQRNLYRIPLH